jgi:hypothetical protein
VAKKDNKTTAPDPKAGENVNKSQGKLTAVKIETLWNNAREDTAPHVVQYWINKAFFLGSQWLVYDVDKGEIQPVANSVKKHREQATENRISPAIVNTIARNQQVAMSFEVESESADDYSQEGARKGESIIRQKHTDDDWESIKKEALLSAILGGTSAIITIWNPKANSADTSLPTGDFFLENRTIEDVVVEPGSKDAKRARWMIDKQILPPEQVQALFDLKQTPPIDGDDSGPWSDKACKYDFRLRKTSGTRVLWYYERPNPLRKDGAVVAVVNHEIVYQGAWPYPFKDHLNIDVIRCITIPGQWMGETYVTQAISVQRQYNHLWTKIHEARNRTMGAKFTMDERHANLNPQLNDDPEKPILLSPLQDAKDPKYLEPPKLPPSTFQEIEALRQELDDQLHVHDISRGVAGTNAPDSGYGLSLLAEQDASPAGDLNKEAARVFSGAASNGLKLYAQFVKDKRKTVISGGRGIAHSLQWTGKDLADQTRVVVPPDSVLPRSHAGMLKMATDLLQNKPDWFPNPTSWLKIATVPGFEDIQEQMDDDVANADYENYIMAQGVAITPEDFDDDAKHIQWHHHFMKSSRYRVMPQKYKDIFKAHVMSHQRSAEHKAGIGTGLQDRHPNLAATPMGQLPGGMPSATMPQLPGSGAGINTPAIPEGIQ